MLAPADTSNAIRHVFDVFLGTPPSCHELDVTLDAASGVAVAPSELLLQKLQIHELNSKDLIDVALLLVGTEIDDERIAAPLSDSWGFYHSATLNLDRVEGLEANGLSAAVAATAADRAVKLRRAIEAAPKSRRWRMTRARRHPGAVVHRGRGARPVGSGTASQAARAHARVLFRAVPVCDRSHVDPLDDREPAVKLPAPCSPDAGESARAIVGLRPRASSSRGSGRS